MHQNEPPPPLRDLNASVSDGVGQIVAKALAKRPEGRYADAGEMLLDLERLLRGEPTGLEVHPRLPDADPRDVICYDFRWELDASPRQLWPHVSNTERLNRAVGLPAVDFTDRARSRRGRPAVRPAPQGGDRGRLARASLRVGRGEAHGGRPRVPQGAVQVVRQHRRADAPARGGHHAGAQHPGRAARDRWDAPWPPWRSGSRGTGGSTASTAGSTRC